MQCNCVCGSCPLYVPTIVYEWQKIYEGRLQSSWTHLITPSRNFVAVQWRSLFQSTSLGKRCTSYDSPPTSWKRAADRWSLRNFLRRSSLFVVEKAQKSHGARSELNSVFGLEEVDRLNPIRTSAIQSRSGWSFVRNASLAKTGTSKRRPSPHLHKVPTRSI
jgi:hypothetical protein